MLATRPLATIAKNSFSRSFTTFNRGPNARQTINGLNTTGSDRRRRNDIPKIPTKRSDMTALFIFGLIIAVIGGALQTLNYQVEPEQYICNVMEQRETKPEDYLYIPLNGNTNALALQGISDLGTLMKMAPLTPADFKFIMESKKWDSVVFYPKVTSGMDTQAILITRDDEGKAKFETREDKVEKHLKRVKSEGKSDRRDFLIIFSPVEVNPELHDLFGAVQSGYNFGKQLGIF